MTKETAINYFRKPYRANGLDGRPSTLPRSGFVQQGEVERVYLQLREWLINAQLPPGEFLSEPDLAKRCSTSRTPVREACMRLLQDGWLSRYPRKGFLVAAISVRDIVDLYQFRKLLECFAVEKAALVVSAEQIAELKALLSQEGKPDADTDAMLRANEAFHLRLAALAGNARVLDQLRLTLHFSRRLNTLYLRVDHSWIAHGDILAALEHHHGAEATKAMAAHLEHAQDCLVKLFGSHVQRSL
jgi:DNA-binding GntR family transcriptional regulator